MIYTRSVRTYIYFYYKSSIKAYQKRLLMYRSCNKGTYVLYVRYIILFWSKWDIFADFFSIILHTISYLSVERMKQHTENLVLLIVLSFSNFQVGFRRKHKLFSPLKSYCSAVYSVSTNEHISCKKLRFMYESVETKFVKCMNLLKNSMFPSWSYLDTVCFRM